MAQILNNVTFARSGKGTYAKLAAEWFDGKARKVQRGVDFTCQRDQFCNVMRKLAKERNGHIQGTLEGCSKDEWIFRYVEGKRGEGVEAPAGATEPEVHTVVLPPSMQKGGKQKAA